LDRSKSNYEKYENAMLKVMDDVKSNDVKASQIERKMKVPCFSLGTEIESIKKSKSNNEKH